MQRTGPGALVGLLLCLGLAACQPDSVADQTTALTVTSTASAERALQTRHFDTRDTTLMLTASAQLLQDLGFQIGETNSATGLVVASKDRTAVEAQQVAGQIALVLAAAFVGVAVNPDYERNQKIRVLVVVQLGEDGKQTSVRATFQRIIFDNYGRISRELTISDPTLYQSFFDKLSQSVFLTGNAI